MYRTKRFKKQQHYLEFCRKDMAFWGDLEPPQIAGGKKMRRFDKQKSSQG